MQDSQATGTSTRLPIVVPSRSDALLRTLTEPVGGPLGKRTGPGRTNPGFFTVERVLVIMAAVSAFIAVMGKGHCRTSGWTTPDQYSTVCWSMFPNAFAENQLGSVFPFLGQGSTFDQPVLAGWVAGLTAWLTQGSGDGALRQLAFFDLNAALIAVLWIATVVLVARSAGRRPWDAAIVAASPVLVLTAFVSWDFWAAALVALAVFLFARRRTLWAGAVLGVAGMAAPYPAVILVALVLLGFRTGRATKMLEMAAAAVIAWLLVLAPVMAQNPPAFPDYLKKLIAAEPSESSLYGGWNLVAGRMGLPQLGLGTSNALAAILFVALLMGLAWLALYAPRRPRVAQLLFIAVAGFTVVNKAAEPWHAIWLLPLLALALPRWRPVLLWQAAVITHFIALMLFQGKVLGQTSNQHAIDTPYFVIAALLAGAASCALLGLVVRDIYAPEHDVVRRGGVDDPQAGVLAGPPADPSQALAAGAEQA
ncbi:glycosyltransferase family 87 protein [Arthrobacter sp. HY1533]|uniref:glycosyltransferase family 87 protein n=1 Tax=Arthrobacter sp. HY1533 TaxID=2970919 RepID=UPI0022BA04E1|nr:glycosyltransferase 87 family protein [Arthrobacter sp. HY1533]